MAIGVAAGLLAGILIVAILGGAEPVIKESTVTIEREVPVGTVVPDLVGTRLDEAVQQLADASLDVDVEGGGLFGVVDEANWEVVDQEPAAGERVEQGTVVTLGIQRA
jgi:beta-lactam-binding protein with PASTA domain